MSKFDTLISTKLGQLNEVLSPATGSVAQPNPTGQLAPQAATTPQATTTSQTAQPTQPQADAPEAALTKIFQTLKFSDPNTAVKTLNTALKGAGQVPGINEFFSSLGYDPKSGFMIAQQKQGTAPAPAQNAPGATPLK